MANAEMPAIVHCHCVRRYAAGNRANLAGVVSDSSSGTGTPEWEGIRMNLLKTSEVVRRASGVTCVS